MPMIAAAFLWPATWPMIWRQATISLWGMGVIFTVERLVGGRPAGQTLAALGAVPARRPVVLVALLAALAMFLGPPVLAVADGCALGPATRLGSAPCRGHPGERACRGSDPPLIPVPPSEGEILLRGGGNDRRGRLRRPASLPRRDRRPVAGFASVLLALALTFPFVVFYERGGRSILPHSDPAHRIERAPAAASGPLAGARVRASAHDRGAGRTLPGHAACQPKCKSGCGVTLLPEAADAGWQRSPLSHIATKFATIGYAREEVRNRPDAVTVAFDK